MSDVQQTPANITQASEYQRKTMLLRRIRIANNMMASELEIPRIPTHNACLLFIDYTDTTPDPLLPEIWGYSENNKFRALQTSKKSGGGSSGCCVIQ